MTDRDESTILNELNALIVELAILRGPGDEGDVISDWVLFADVNNFVMGKEGDGYYNMTMRHGIPIHVAKGLVRHGSYLLFQGDSQ